MANSEALRLALKLVERAAEVRTYDEYVDEGFEYLDEPVPLGWDQGRWVNYAILPEGFCLTAGCLAGHVAINDGYDQIEVSDEGQSIGIWNPDTGDTLTWSGPDSVGEYARSKLGLNQQQAEVLFESQNTLDDLREIVEELCASEMSAPATAT